ncbi:GNAT family N-acetyltransferase [Pseudanabaena sp. PCC 6802]|uniref:GNAT family N-acetyltransferase n=1 Tax=Pseudanabaena sp. PCC 6802 TaxID=118173 RepID=UPI00034D115D|nr:N-acetyltransferase [Pseudanabaena sp. PCC 6802]
MHAIEIPTSKDFEAIADLNVSAYAEFAPYLQPGSWEIMQKTLRNIAERAERSEFVVCRSGDNIVGSVAYCRAGKGDPAIFTPDMASILVLAVHPQHRGKGIAKVLILSCISRAKSDRAGSIGLFTNELMLPAQHIYRCLGFQQDLELPKRYGIRYFRFVLLLDS